MNRAIILLLFLIAAATAEDDVKGLRADGLCDGNRFLFLSTYLLGRQQDMTLTMN